MPVSNLINHAIVVVVVVDFFFVLGVFLFYCLFQVGDTAGDNPKKEGKADHKEALTFKLMACQVFIINQHFVPKDGRTAVSQINLILFLVLFVDAYIISPPKSTSPWSQTRHISVLV